MEPDVADRLAAGMPWLDGPAEILQTVSEPVLGPDAPRGLKDALYGVWLGHPLHPAVVAMPIGCWSAAALFDLTGEERAADLLVDLGIGTSLAAAATGLAQYRDATNDEAPRRIGALHALLNTGALALYAGSSVARKRGNRSGGVALSTLGLAVTMASGWLGGELAYVMGIGVDRNAFESAPKGWIDVAEAAALEPGTPLRAMAGDMAVLVVQDEDGIHAIGATCSHLGGPLDKGEVEDGCVTCPWHGSVFRLADGTVAHGPATSPQPRFDVRIHNGRVSVRPHRAEPIAAPVPTGAPEPVRRVADAAQHATDRVLEVLPGHGQGDGQDVGQTT